MEKINPILLVPSGVITAEEKKAAFAAGYIVIITDEPEKIKILTPISTMDGLDLLNSAIIGLDSEVADYGKKAFIKELAKRIKDKILTT